MSDKSVFCIAPSRNHGERIVDRLRMDLSNSDIVAWFADTAASRDLALETNTKTLDVVLAGVGTGGIVGGALGWIASIGALAIPLAGPFIAAGWLLAALSGAAIGAVVGGVTAALIGLQMRRFEQKLKRGNILISVHTDSADEIARAGEIFATAQAQDNGCVESEASTPNDSKATGTRHVQSRQPTRVSTC